MNFRPFAPVLSILFIIAFNSCSQEEFCTESLVSEVNIGFFDGNIDTMISNTIYRFQAKGLGHDSIINASDSTSVSEVKLQLSNSRDTSSFLFDYTIVRDSVSPAILADTIDLQDTLHVYYTRTLSYISPACGFIYNYNLINVVSTHNYIETILIINPYISTLDEENIKILYKSADLF